MWRRGFRLACGVGFLAVVAVVPAARAGSRAGAPVIDRPAYPSPVAAANGVVAWAVPSDTSGQSFEIVVRSGGHNRPLTTTAAAGWIPSLSLGTAADGSSIVVYARCPLPPTAYGPDSAGCRLWWVPVGGGTPTKITAAPANSDIGVAVGGTVTFAVNTNVAVGDGGVPVELEQATLTGTTVHALRVPAPVGAVIDGISATATQVAFIETPNTIGTQAVYTSEIWLDTGRAKPKRIARAISAADYPNPRISYFVGLTLTGASVYAFVYAQPGSQANSQLEQIALPSLSVTTVPWQPAQPLGADAVDGAAFDPTDSKLVASLFPPKLPFTPGTPCSTQGGLAGACPIVWSGPVTW